MVDHPKRRGHNEANQSEYWGGLRVLSCPPVESCSSLAARGIGQGKPSEGIKESFYRGWFSYRGWFRPARPWVWERRFMSRLHCVCCHFLGLDSSA
jgi:hypothetical protein